MRHWYIDEADFSLPDFSLTYALWNSRTFPGFPGE